MTDSPRTNPKINAHAREYSALRTIYTVPHILYCRLLYRRFAEKRQCQSLKYTLQFVGLEKRYKLLIQFREESNWIEI